MFGNLRNVALTKLQEFFDEEMQGVLDERNYPKGGLAAVNIRYIGVFSQVARGALVIKYLLAHCKTNICMKTSGDTLIY